MKMLRLTALASLVALVVPASAGAQTPEMARLKEMAGEWDCVVKMLGQETKGVNVSKVEVGGNWLVSDFKMSIEGQPYVGKGLDTYDPIKKKYVGVWCDSMTNGPMVSEGNLEGNKLVMTGEGPGHDGKPVKHKMITTYKGKDEMTFEMYNVADGKDTLAMTIDYKRKK